MSGPREAVILASGPGTGLRAVVSGLPKPLAPVAGRPFLHWLVGGADPRAQVTEAPFLDIGTPEDFIRAQTLISARAGAV